MHRVGGEIRRQRRAGGPGKRGVGVEHRDAGAFEGADAQVGRFDQARQVVGPQQDAARDAGARGAWNREQRDLDAGGAGLVRDRAQIGLEPGQNGAARVRGAETPRSGR